MIRAEVRAALQTADKRCSHGDTECENPSCCQSCLLSSGGYTCVLCLYEHPAQLQDRQTLLLAPRLCTYCGLWKAARSEAKYERNPHLASRSFRDEIASRANHAPISSSKMRSVGKPDHGRSLISCDIHQIKIKILKINWEQPKLNSVP